LNIAEYEIWNKLFDVKNFYSAQLCPDIANHQKQMAADGWYMVKTYSFPGTAINYEWPGNEQAASLFHISLL
jgi:GH18 family chitinase